MKSYDPAAREPAGGDHAGAPPVIGIGFSAGGIEPLETFFDSLGGSPEAAFVVIQHGKSEDREGHLVEILQHHTAMPICMAEDNTAIRPDHVYVVPRGVRASLENNVLLLDATAGPSRRPVDHLFSSLARDRGPAAAGVVLSGSGSDGAIGFKALKEAGALTVVQSPEEAKVRGMPEAGLATGMVDLALPVGSMGEAIVGFVHRATQADASTTEERIRAQLGEICTILGGRTGHQFHNYKPGTLVRRTKKRMDLLGLVDLEAYLERLKSPEDPEADELFQEILVDVTYFFRDPEIFQTVATQVIPTMMRARSSSHDKPLRIWVPGCATGEEAYTLAILCREHQRHHPEAPAVQIFASDLNPEAVEIARRGRYPQGIANHVPGEHLSRYFVYGEDNASYKISEDVRDLIVFCVHNLIADPPFAELDLISCRNVLIYFSDELQRQVIDRFSSVLNPEAYLLLGPSESLRVGDDRFSASVSHHSLFQHKALPNQTAPKAPAHSTQRRVPAMGLQRTPVEASSAVPANLEETVFREFGPAVAVVNRNFELVYRGGPTRPYLELPHGQTDTNLLHMVHEDLRFDLRAALEETMETGKPCHKEGLLVREADDLEPFGITARPLPVKGADQQFFAVQFRESRSKDAGKASGPAGEQAPDWAQERIRQLERELVTTKRHLRTASEDMEASHEELRSGNEVLISLIEQLQSSNEELQTSQEELQSVNTELNQVNAELRSKIEALNTANADLQNMFKSTQTPTLFLDRTKAIKRFTPEVRHLVRIIDSDIGRPLTDIASSLDGVDLSALIDDVMATGQPVGREIQVSEGQWYSLRIHPYTTIEGRLDGSVLTFYDISVLKKSEIDHAKFTALVEMSNDQILFKDPDGILRAWSRGAEAMYGYKAEEAIGRHVDLIVPEDRRTGLRKVHKRVLDGETIAPFDTVRKTKDGRHLDINICITRVTDHSGNILGISTIGRDVTERKELERELQTAQHRAEQANTAKSRFLAQMSHELRTPLGVIKGFLDLIFEGSLSPQDTDRLVERTRVNLDMLQRLIDDILDLAKIEEGKIVIEEEPFDPRSLIDEVTEVLSSKAQTQGLGFTVQIPDDIPGRLRGDAVRLRQVLYNLTSNAVKYVETGSIEIRATLEATPEGSWLAVRVSDTGPGIPAKDRNRVFEPFERATQGPQAASGVGLGLYLCRQIAQAMGGDLSLERTAPGEGSVFLLRVPAIAEQSMDSQSQPEASEEGPPDLTGMKILVAEDSQDNQLLLQLLLSQEGATLDFVGDGQSAVEKGEQTPYDLVLMDLQMPRMDGYEAIRKLRAGGYDGPVVALTAHVMTEEQERCIEAGFDDYLTKPMLGEKLIATVGKYRNRQKRS